MAFQDLRAFMGRLQAEGELLELDQPINPRFEYCALLAELDRGQGPALHATNVVGPDATLAGNLLGTRRRLALGLESDEASLGAEYLRRKNELIPPLRSTADRLRKS